MMDYELDEEEREILKLLEQGDANSVQNVERRIEEARQKARITLNDHAEVRVLLSPGEFETARLLAEERGLSYQFLVSNIVRKGLRGMLVKCEQHGAIEATRTGSLLHGNDAEEAWPGKKLDYELDEEEREILEQLERDDACSVPDLDGRIEEARRAAYNTLKDYTEVSVSLSPRELQIALEFAEALERPYEILVENAVSMYLDGMLVDRNTAKAATAGGREFPRLRE